ncbi:MAG: V-type ATPase subunit [Lachnospiraceae bacterium]|nr:V-type ATPase subunit [Lachnospiraceae bacterium]
MIGAYIDKSYVYAVARIRLMELKLLSKHNFDELIVAKDKSNIKRILKEKDWGADEDADFLSIIKNERVKLWQFIDEIVPDREVFSVFDISSEYHNLKAAIKESTLDFDYSDIYIDGATTPYSVIKSCIDNKAYGDLPSEMVEVAREAHEILLKTGDGQLCDAMIDRKAIEEIEKKGLESKEKVIEMYAKLVAAAYNIKISVRSALTNKDSDFMERAIADTTTIDRDLLISATQNGVDAICNYLLTTDYSDAVPYIKKSLTAFEKWCDDLIIDRMRGMLYESFGIGPVAAYILAKEQEIKNLRIIYTGIANGFSADMIRERVRDSYV